MRRQMMLPAANVCNDTLFKQYEGQLGRSSTRCMPQALFDVEVQSICIWGGGGLWRQCAALAHKRNAD